ncbi:MAG TPA: FAD-binding oxidoreductase [Bacteroidales bacterium]
MKKFDYLIVGQGIAGSLLAYFLVKRNKSFLVVDEVHTGSASRIAAGIFNPITGRRFVKTWMADEIFPFAEETYRELELFLGKKVFHQMNVIRKFGGQAEYREWELKCTLPSYQAYLEDTLAKKNTSGDDFGLVEIKNSGWLDVQTFTDSFRSRLLEEKILLETEFDGLDLVFENENILWKDFTFSKVIFCEGYRVLDNPFFKQLPFTHAKGEILTIRAKKLKLEKILSKGIFILPIGNHLFKVGSTYDWNDLDEKPTEQGKKELAEKLEKIIGNKFEIVSHRAGIRPTVIDRRPILGFHPVFSNLGILNGMGTKGISLAPFFANHFVEFLLDNKPLMPEVDLRRFMK